MPKDALDEVAWSSDMKVIVTNRQNAFRVSTAGIRRLTAWLLRFAVGGASSPAKSFNTIEIILTDDAGIVAVNQAVFGRAAITDVISQVYAPLPGEQGRMGELVVNVALAARAGARRAGGPDRELALYLAHGCDHPGGARDATAAGRAAMLRRERGWLDAAGGPACWTECFAEHFGERCDEAGGVRRRGLPWFCQRAGHAAGSGRELAGAPAVTRWPPANIRQRWSGRGFLVLRNCEKRLDLCVLRSMWRPTSHIRSEVMADKTGW
ncbi:MAG: rRNA maturation RNAse YbeY [Kiritimatiellaeota bacterium]|nr:rRNA maturation RNAse YbeY [Kiritimatiellota bacterium]